MKIVIDYNLFNKIRIYESISSEINKKGSCFLIAEYQLIKEKIHMNLPISDADNIFGKIHSHFKKLPSKIETT